MEQLDAGVRYLDLQIALMLDGSEKNLQFVHMVYTMALVEDTLPEISEWLERHPREVVILACRNFEGLSEDLHDYLICIKTIFGEMLCPRGNPTWMPHHIQLPCVSRPPWLWQFLRLSSVLRTLTV
ncbi:PI-PLC X domain-containing protein 1-like [Aotus nancymaae]|uniref:PI-PLC X domain-containing protein 1-like n=1 Tax=Aotus nancymaae TaxID=37293 RepID=UPI0030FE5085